MLIVQDSLTQKYFEIRHTHKRRDLYVYHRSVKAGEVVVSTKSIPLKKTHPLYQAQYDYWADYLLKVKNAIHIPKIATNDEINTYRPYDLLPVNNDTLW